MTMTAAAEFSSRLVFLAIALAAHAASAGELPYSIILSNFSDGPSLIWCEKLNPEHCAQTLDAPLYWAGVWIDFGRQVNVSGFLNRLPQQGEDWPFEEYMDCLSMPGDIRVCDSNRRETLSFRESIPSTTPPLTEIEVTESGPDGLSAEFDPVASRYVIWSVWPEFREWEDDTYIWRELVQPNNGRIHGLQFYGEPLPEPPSWTLLPTLLAIVGYVWRRGNRGMAEAGTR